MKSKLHCHNYLQNTYKERCVSMNTKYNFENDLTQVLYDQLKTLSHLQFKAFFSILTHYWLHHKCFISRNNFHNLWCELNLLCHEFDESFPNQYDDYDEMLSYCINHPFYFIDILPIDLISALFAVKVDDRIETLMGIIKALSETGIHTAYAYANNALDLKESVSDLTTETQDHLNRYN